MTPRHLHESEVIAQFQAALATRDIVSPRNLVTDGKLHRCDTAGRGGKNDAVYLLHLNGFPAGGFQNHRDGIGWEAWRADIGRLLTPAEREEGHRRAEAAGTERTADRERRRAEAAGKAERIWQQASEAPADHPYLTRKNVGPFGLRLYRGKLVIRAQGADDDQLHSLQFIGPDGDKRF